MKGYLLATAVLVVCLGTDILAQNYIRLSRYDPNFITPKRNYIRLSRQDPNFVVDHNKDLDEREEILKPNTFKRNYIRLSRKDHGSIVDHPTENEDRPHSDDVTEMPFPTFQKKANYVRLAKKANYVRLAKKDTHFADDPRFYQYGEDLY